MPVYNERNGLSLLTNASDEQGLPIRVRRVNGSIINWAGGPATVSLFGGAIIATITEFGAVTLNSTADANNPANGSTKTIGSFTYTLWNGVEETNTLTSALTWEGASSLADTAYVTSGQIARWTAGSGITASGSDVTAWLDQVSNKALTVVGTPQRVTGVGGTVNQMVKVETDEGFTFSDLTSFPTSNADRTLQFLARFTGTQKFFGGFGYGTNSAGQAFTISVNDLGQLALDIASSRYLIAITPTSQFVMVTARLSGGVLSVWLAGVKVFEQAVTLTTGLTRGNVCRSFSNKTTTADICLMLAYGRALSDAEIRTNVDVAKGEFIGTGQVTNASAVTGSSITQNDFVASGNATISYGVRAWSVRTSPTAATEAEVLAGTGATLFGVTILDGSAAWSRLMDGLAPNTAYYVNCIDYDLTGGKSAVVRSAAITTAAAGGPAPVISALSVPTVNAGGGAAQFTSDQAGTYDAVIYLATAPDPTLADIEAGEDGAGQPVLAYINDAAAAAATNGITITGLNSSTGYRIAVAVRNGAGQASNVLVAAFTTAAGSGTVKDDVIGLSNGSTPVGRTSANGLKTIGTHGVPAGWAIGGSTGQSLLAQANGVSLEDYQLTDLRVDTNGKTDATVRQNRILLSGTAFNATYLTYLSVGGDRAVFEFNDIWGNFGVSDESALAYHPYSGNSAARGVVFRRNSLKWMQNDGFKFSGAGILIDECYFGPPAQVNSDIEQYSGTPGDYFLNDYVRFDPRDYVRRCAVAQASIAPTNSSDNTQWVVPGPHTDLTNALANVGAGSTVRRSYFEMNRKSPLAIRSANFTNALRLVRNSSQAVEWNKFVIEEAYIAVNNTGASVPIQSSADGSANYNGPIEVYDSWIGRNYGGAYFQDSSNKVTVWDNVRDQVTDAILAQP